MIATCLIEAHGYRVVPAIQSIGRWFLDLNSHSQMFAFFGQSKVVAPHQMHSTTRKEHLIWRNTKLLKEILRNKNKDL